MPILVPLFIVVPLVELAVIIRVGQVLGLVPTLALLLSVSIVGAWLAKREGLGVYRRFREQVGSGRVPAAEIVDGVLVIVAAALLLTPGFVTDGVALLLLVPPVRAAVRGWLRRLAGRRARLSLGLWGSAADRLWKHSKRRDRPGRASSREVPMSPEPQLGDENGREP
ncbi:MAG TPA: FxsA family protein [Actinomycetota bacterium]|nr:FxsA family protein [Actinomycetota bacterium]